MKTLRTAIVGLGRIGWKYHIRQVHAHPGFTLVAGVDPLPDRLEEGRVEYGINGYLTLEEMLAKEQLDLVVIASPTAYHCQQTIMALEAGVDVFLDKPMAATREEAERMVDAMRRTGRKLSMFQPMRIEQYALTLRDLLAEGLIGDIYHYRSTGVEFRRRNDWQSVRRMGGGLVNNGGSHTIDVMLYLSGKKVVETYGFCKHVTAIGDAEDMYEVIMKTEDGAILEANSSWAAALGHPGWTILGNRGAIQSQWNAEGAQEYLVRWFDPAELPELALFDDPAAPLRSYSNLETIPWKEKVVPISADPPPDFYNFVYDHYALDKPPLVPVEHTLEVMRILEIIHAGEIR